MDGRVRRPGAAPADVELSLAGRATAVDRAEARWTERALAAAEGGGTFHGRVTVELAPLEGADVRVVGTLGDVELDLVRATTLGTTGELERAAALTRRLGIHLDDEEPEDEAPVSCASPRKARPRKRGCSRVI